MVALAAPPQSPHIALEMFFQRLRGVAARRDTKGWAEKERIILESCHPLQKPFVEDTAKRIVVLCSGRAGKTSGGRRRLLRRMMKKRGAKCLFIAKSAPAAEDLMWAPLKEACERLGLEARFREDRLRMTLVKNGSTLRLVGADDTAEIDKLRGQPFDEVGIDEAASHKPENLQYLIEQAVGPRLGDYRGTLWLAGTPGNVLRGMFYDLTKPGGDAVPYDEIEPGALAWSMHKWGMKEAAPYVEAIRNAWESALIEKTRNGWSDGHPAWRREYLGEWAADDTQMMFRYQADVEGVPWNQWDPKKDEMGVAILPKPKGTWHYAMALDLGGGHSRNAAAPAKMGPPKNQGDPTAIEVVAWDDQDPAKSLYHVYEHYSRERLYAKKLAQLFLGEDLKSDGSEGLFGRIGYPSAIAADIGSLGILVLEELAQVYGIAIEPWDAQKLRHSAVEGTNGDLIDGRFKVMKGSMLEQQFSNLQWDIDRYGMLTKNKRQQDHAADAGIIARSKAHHLLAEEVAPPAKRESKFESVGKERDPEPVRGEFDSLLQEDGGGYWGAEDWG